jgi:pimeloyl-ACP methyl ester carboxylesterase
MDLYPEWWSEFASPQQAYGQIFTPPMQQSNSESLPQTKHRIFVVDIPPHAAVNTVSATSNDISDQKSTHSKQSRSGDSDSDKVTTVFFIHGAGGRAEQWLELIKLFMHECPHYHLVALDLAGHGRSWKPAAETDTGTDTVYTTASFVADVIAVFDQYCTDTNIIVGHSMGSTIAMQTVHYLQQRAVSTSSSSSSSTTTSTATATATGTATVTDADADADVKLNDSSCSSTLRLPEISLVLIGTAASVPDASGANIFCCCPCFLECLRPLISAKSRELIFAPGIDASLVDREVRVTNQNPMYVVRSMIRQLKWSTADIHNHITVPVLILQGDSDLLMPMESAQQLCAELPNAELIQVQNAGHNVHLEQPHTLFDHIHQWYGKK